MKLLWRPITCGCAETTAPLLVEVLDGRVLEVEELLFDVIVLFEEKVKRVQKNFVDHRLNVTPAFLLIHGDISF